MVESKKKKKRKKEEEEGGWRLKITYLQTHDAVSDHFGFSEWRESVWWSWRRTNSRVKVFIPWSHQSGPISCRQSSAEVARQQGAAPGAAVVRSRAPVDMGRLCLCAGGAASGSCLLEGRGRHTNSINNWAGPGHQRHGCTNTKPGWADMNLLSKPGETYRVKCTLPSTDPLIELRFTDSPWKRDRRTFTFRQNPRAR